MRKILRWLDSNFESVILGVFLIIITLAIFLQVIMRYLFNSALSWPEELSRYCFVCSTLLSLSYCTRNKSMMRVDALVSLLPKLANKWLDFFVLFLSLALYVVLFVFSLSTTALSQSSGQLSTALQIPMYLIYGWGSVCFMLACLRSAQALFQQLRDILAKSTEGGIVP